MRDEINRNLKRNVTGLKIESLPSSVFYKDTSYNIWSDGNRLLINILFPLVSSKFQEFEVYEVILPKIFFNDSNVMYSKLTDIPKYFAISNKDRVFIELDDLEE